METEKGCQKHAVQQMTADDDNELATFFSNLNWNNVHMVTLSSFL